jgi:hypothetical protein
MLKYFDPAEINYFYKSAPGLALLFIKLVFGFLWFIYSVFFTLKNYPEKRYFYIMLLVVFCIWFWAGPILICKKKFLNILKSSLAIFYANCCFIGCCFAISDTFRTSVNYMTQTSVISFGHAFFLVREKKTND